VAPSSAILAAVAAIRPEPTASSTHWRAWRGAWRGIGRGIARAAGSLTAWIEGPGAGIAIGSRVVAPSSTVGAAVAAIRPEPAASSRSSAAAATSCAAASKQIIPNPAARLGQLTQRPTTLPVGTRGQKSILLSLLVVHTPICIRQHVIVCPIEPLTGAAQVQDIKTCAPL